MPRGYWDWGVNPTGVVLPAQINLAEHAARTGSIVTFDRRGDVIWYDDFESSLNKWVAGGSGTGNSVAISTARARNGGNSVLLTAGSSQALNASISHQQPLPTLGPVGFEISVNIQSAINRFSLIINYNDGATLHQSEITWRDTENDLRYLDSSANYVTFAADVDLFFTDRLFHTCKLIIDPNTGKYISFVLNNTRYSLSDIDLYTAASATLPNLEVIAQLRGRSGNNDTTYVDDAILTQNEP